MKPRICIENEQTEKAPFRGYKTALRRAIAATLIREGFLRPSEIGVTLVTREEIRRLNREFRDVDRETDVLSFPLMEEEEPEEDVAYLGDVIHVLRSLPPRPRNSALRSVRKCA
ncbi:MAG: rRNA maturation RNase YbeY [Clostridia bacterium]|nr:rRNA maturation RNase YbeY [Clostridia bacterium]